MTFKEKVAQTKEYLLSLHDEVDEVLHTLPWKTHRKYKEDFFKIEDLREELIDVFKFLLNVYIIWGITPDKMMKDFTKKSEKVLERLKEEKDAVKTRKEV